MKQLQYFRRGGPEVLAFAEAPHPAAGKGEIVIDVRAASINPSDTKVRTGALAYLAPFRRRPWGMGLEAAGMVASTGPNSSFTVGDRVFGMVRDGKGFAEAAVILERNAIRIPAGLSYSQAATIAMAGGMATAITAKLNLGPDKRVFINGAAGGIGLFLIQLLSHSGVTVVGTSSAAGIEVVLKAGAAEAYDYRAFQAATHTGRYDVIIDTAGSMTYGIAKLLLAREAAFYTLTPTLSSLLEQVRSVHKKQRVRSLFVLPKRAAISRFAEDIARGTYFVQIGAEAPLDEAITIMRDLEANDLNPIGKVVLTRDVANPHPGASRTA